MTILEQLWYGKLHPAEIKRPLDPQYAKLLDTADKTEKKLLSLLTDEEKELFQKLDECRNELYDMDSCNIFISGFRLGARLMPEITNTDE